MRAQFPALCHALGERLFNDFAAEYVRLHPPQRYTLHDLGRRFTAFLEEQRPDRAEPVEARGVWIDFVIDLARFERRLFELFDSPAAKGKALPRPDAPAETLQLQAAFIVDRFDFNVAACYHAVRRGEAPPALARGAVFVARFAPITPSARSPSPNRSSCCSAGCSVTAGSRTGLKRWRQLSNFPLKTPRNRATAPGKRGPVGSPGASSSRRREKENGQ